MLAEYDRYAMTGGLNSSLGIAFCELKVQMTCEDKTVDISLANNLSPSKEDADLEIVSYLCKTL